ncbi:hypothetical protein [Lacisediminihabitans profunda]|uniref:Uncharacterized protein n=1 Tax=Lacisediminihabitans profunda TaxID=2594790 RepID=A0A5C8UQ81_9MICO|nr:hypothetical protein [Lacisediminihabitans profunda]TXN30021.1 hypothetical protein FVP33_12920 [Lacisediminihabitans profunda]
MTDAASTPESTTGPPTSGLPTSGAPATDTSRPAARLGWVGIGVAIVIGLFYAYDLFEAISNVVGVVTQINATNGVRKAVDLAPVPTPWTLLVIDLAIAPVVYVTAFLLARRRSLVLAVLLLVGLTAVAAMSASLVALA